MSISPRLAAALTVLVGTCLATAAEQSAPGHQPTAYIGYYHDGSGVFRGCTPVSSWNEYDFREEQESYQDKGKTKTRKHEVPDKPNHQNIVYKVPHYNWCNGGMIIAGGKLFALSDRGGLGFYAERAADFAGAELFCIDPATGKELWKKDLNHWDLTPQGAQMTALIQEYNKRQAETFGAYLPLGSAMRARSGGFQITEEHYQELIQPLKGLIPDLPPTYAAVKGHIVDHTGYPQGHFFEKIQPKYWPEIKDMRKKILDAGYLQDPWGGCGAPLGLNMQTPVSDGKHIWVSTAYGGLFCLDLDGNFVWRTTLGPGWYRGAAIPSPVLVDDLLIVVGLDEKGRQLDKFRKDAKAMRLGIDQKTGKIVWEAPYSGSYQPGPVVLSLPVAGDTTKMLKVLYFCGDGVVLRAADGKQLASRLPAAWSARPPSVSRDIIVFDNKRADGGSCKVDNDVEKGWGAMRLSVPSVDRVDVDVLWQGKDWGWSNLVASGDVLFHMDGKPSNGTIESYDIRSGDQIAQAKGGVAGSFHYTILAGDHLIGLDVKGFSGVARVSPDGKSLQAIGTSRLGDRLYGQKGGPPLDGKFSYGCQFFASGNRIFIRSMTHLYCLGDPQAKTVLSPEHR